MDSSPADARRSQSPLTPSQREHVIDAFARALLAELELEARTPEAGVISRELGDRENDDAERTVPPR